MGEIWGRYGGDMGEVWGRYRGGMGRYGGGMGEYSSFAYGHARTRLVYVVAYDGLRRSQPMSFRPLLPLVVRVGRDGEQTRGGGYRGRRTHLIRVWGDMGDGEI